MTCLIEQGFFELLIVDRGLAVSKDSQSGFTVPSGGVPQGSLDKVCILEGIFCYMLTVITSDMLAFQPIDATKHGVGQSL